MALTERSRNARYQGPYQGLTDVIDEEAVSEMLSYFPARDGEEPVTQEFLHAEAADLRVEMTELGADLRVEMAELGADLRAEMTDLRVELTATIHREVQSSTRWCIASMFTLTGLILAVTAAIH
jgi:hypothetical protein